MKDEISNYIKNNFLKLKFHSVTSGEISLSAISCIEIQHYSTRVMNKSIYVFEGSCMVGFYDEENVRCSIRGVAFYVNNKVLVAEPIIISKLKDME